MPRRPVRIQQGAYGTRNPAVAYRTAAPALLSKGPAYALEQTGDRQQNQTQQNADQATRQVRALPFADGNMLEGVSFTGGQALTLQHGLGAPFRGFDVMNVRGAGSTFFMVPNNPNSLPNLAMLDARQIQIQASATCTADVWVYK